jgi:hypothetical protein
MIPEKGDGGVHLGRARKGGRLVSEIYRGGKLFFFEAAESGYRAFRNSKSKRLV